MFEKETYIRRREGLIKNFSSGLILIMGNEESPVTYPDAFYPFRQDSTFLYFFGIVRPGLAGLIDLDEGRQYLFGDDLTLNQIIWMGPRPSLDQMGELAGVAETRPYGRLPEVLKTALAKEREIRILPPYRGSRLVALQKALGVGLDELDGFVSPDLIGAVVKIREIKEPAEVAQIEEALEVTREMHLLAMSMARPGMTEKEIFTALKALAEARGGGLAFDMITTVHGEILHQRAKVNTLQSGGLFILDGGVLSELCYASDITRTTPVGGRFEPRQRDIYEIVLAANLRAIEMTRPGVTYREVFLEALGVIAAGLKNLGLMKGDPVQAATRGAVSLFMPHGLGHQMGLDVHDMEDLGEDLVGYDQEIVRDSRFGLSSLRFGRRLFPGLILTDEPGCYFIPDLIDAWRAGGKFREFINYEQVEKYKDFGGVRIEDDILVTQDGCRVLGRPIPKTIAQVEEAAA